MFKRFFRWNALRQGLMTSKGIMNRDGGHWFENIMRWRLWGFSGRRWFFGLVIRETE